MARHTDDECRCGHPHGAHRYEGGCCVVGCMCLHFERRPAPAAVSTVGKLPCKCCGKWLDEIEHDGVCPQCRAKVDGIIKISQVESYNDWDD